MKALNWSRKLEVIAGYDSNGAPIWVQPRIIQWKTQKVLQ